LCLDSYHSSNCGVLFILLRAFYSYIFFNIEMRHFCYSRFHFEFLFYHCPHRFFLRAMSFLSHSLRHCWTAWSTICRIRRKRSAPRSTSTPASNARCCRFAVQCIRVGVGVERIFSDPISKCHMPMRGSQCNNQRSHSHSCAGSQCSRTFIHMCSSICTKHIHRVCGGAILL
jgi:hypothetical protein